MNTSSASALRRIIAILVALSALALPACSTDDSVTCAPPDARSIARQWNEVMLDAIRRDNPWPTVNARTLFHLSAVMWDAWTAYGDDPGTGWFLDLDIESDNIEADRHEAISYGAYVFLRRRILRSKEGVTSTRDFIDLMNTHCYDIAEFEREGDSPSAVGSRIALAAIEATLTDGALEDERYQVPDDYYVAANEPMPIDDPGANLDDPNRWQPLSFSRATSQGGAQLPPGPQDFLTPQWIDVDAFALDVEPGVLPLDPGDPPYLGDPETDAEFRDAVVAVIRAASLLDSFDGETIDVSPGVVGNNSLGTDDGTGHPVNPATGEPYEANVVSRGDWGKAVAEFWADGPESETPPGHWNTLANEVSDHPEFERRIGGTGDVVDALEWDVKMYLALNGALHDAAIAGWAAKEHYDYVRPVSLIRWMGGLGQASDPDQLSFDENGLPLVEGLIEVVTDESSAPGERHEDFADQVGEIVIRSWTGDSARAVVAFGHEIENKTPMSPVAWIRAVDWIPFQRSTFVTPAFPGYVSGHSTFSRAAAEVMTSFTGDAYFPGGLATHTVDTFVFEDGPAEPVELQWATYRDAADEAGQSRIWGGIHVWADDYQGRIMGASCGEAAWELAQRVFAGT